MKVYFVQHGKAKNEAVDLQRPLSEQGIIETKKMAELLAGSGLLMIEKIFYSSKLRAQQTAEIFAKAFLSVDEVFLMSNISPMDDVSYCIQAINKETENIMIVGHLPHLSKTISKLICNKEDLPIVTFKYSGVICVEKQADDRWTIVPLFSD